MVVRTVAVEAKELAAAGCAAAGAAAALEACTGIPTVPLS